MPESICLSFTKMSLTGRLPELLAATHLGNGSLLLEWSSAASGWQPQTVTLRLQVTSAVATRDGNEISRYLY